MRFTHESSDSPALALARRICASWTTRGRMRLLGTGVAGQKRGPAALLGRGKEHHEAAVGDGVLGKDDARFGPAGVLDALRGVFRVPLGRLKALTHGRGDARFFERGVRPEQHRAAQALHEAGHGGRGGAAHGAGGRGEHAARGLDEHGLQFVGRQMGRTRLGVVVHGRGRRSGDCQGRATEGLSEVGQESVSIADHDRCPFLLILEGVLAVFGAGGTKAHAFAGGQIARFGLLGYGAGLDRSAAVFHQARTLGRGLHREVPQARTPVDEPKAVGRELFAGRAQVLFDLAAAVLENALGQGNRNWADRVSGRAQRAYIGQILVSLVAAQQRREHRPEGTRVD